MYQIKINLNDYLVINIKKSHKKIMLVVTSL